MVADLVDLSIGFQNLIDCIDEIWIYPEVRYLDILNIYLIFVLKYNF